MAFFLQQNTNTLQPTETGTVTMLEKILRIPTTVQKTYLKINQVLILIKS